MTRGGQYSVVTVTGLKQEYTSRWSLLFVLPLMEKRKCIDLETVKVSLVAQLED